MGRQDHEQEQGSSLKRLPSEVIENLKFRPGVYEKVIEGFLAMMGSSLRVTISKLWRDASQLGLNAATVIAIRDGINLVFEKELFY